jgi:hypothetical protein
MTVSDGVSPADVVAGLPRDQVLLLAEVIALIRGEALFVPSGGVSSTTWCCWHHEPSYRLDPEYAAAVEWLESRGLVWLEPYHLRLDENNEPLELDLVALTGKGRECYELLTRRLLTDA